MDQSGWVIPGAIKDQSQSHTDVSADDPGRISNLNFNLEFGIMGVLGMMDLVEADQPGGGWSVRP